MVRQFEETRRSHLAVALSTDLADYATEDELELAVAVAASLGLQAISQDKDLTVVTSSGNLMTQTGLRLLDDCSRIEAVQGRSPLRAVAASAAAQAPDASVAVLLAGATPDPRALRSAAARFPVDVIVAVVRCLPGSQLRRKTLGGAVVLEIGGLADLPKAMRAL
jgi:nucleotide-binding universal stress UspA family protein